MKGRLHALTMVLGVGAAICLLFGVVFLRATFLAWTMILFGLFLPVLVARLYAGTFPETENAAWVARRLHGSDKPKDLVIVKQWEQRLRERREAAGNWWDLRNLMNTQGIGKQWAGGYTIHLDSVARDVTAEVKHGHVPAHLYGRRVQVEILEQMLVRSKGAANTVLVGPPGVGKHEIIKALAHRFNTGQTFGALRYMRLLEIDTSAVVAGANSLNAVVQKIKGLFGEAHRVGNVILVINDIDAFFDPSPEAGRVNATEALLPFLESRLRIIGLTTLRGYQSTIGKNSQLQRLISKLEINEPSASETLMILQDEVIRIERQSGLFFTHQALVEIVELSQKLIADLPQPEKALEVLQEVAVYCATKVRQKVVLPEHVEEVITARTKVPAGKVMGEEKDLLLNLEARLHERVIGQDEAIRQIANALRRARSGVRSEKRPIGSFLFLGPTGVGKTETTKAMAAIYFGDDPSTGSGRMLRFDMSEFQDSDTFTARLTQAVIESPFAVVLLDEIEKAHTKVLDLLLQVLDEGRLTDSEGRKVSFVNTMIVATSNASAETIRETVQAGKNLDQQILLDELQSQGKFKPEFLNRFDGIITFRPLSESELWQVATLLLAELNLRLREKEIQIKITPELAAAVTRGGYNPEFGARPLRRYIQEHIENYIAKGLLDGSIKPGDTVEIPREHLNFPSS